ncbi:hypothetical protein BP5796_11306 [Coleophoma crateriformis]|uniref:Prion-inhibition and propagation HeLo domain-containing protein n=1 Tax=Coleophoma crateriformis TaxID=565419 RepID=A0A3D8QJ03_9HELO|nr:hypothetical protein BP5796_11306 [Coleophoma crateriformis]
MLSGVEIAGLVLAAFPLVISAAEHYREGFEPLSKWKRFRTDFIGFLDAIDIEKQLFEQVLERFLISADVPQEELHRFLTQPNHSGWDREDLVERLEARLGPSLPAYVSTIKTMNGLMKELEGLLLIRDGEIEWASEGASRWDYQLKRIRLSFSKKGARTLLALETHNRKLRELLDSNDKLESVKATRKDTAWANIFECIKVHAGHLHSAISNSWRCGCTSPHMTALRLQTCTTGEWASQFHISFPDSRESPLYRKEAVVTINSGQQNMPHDRNQAIHPPSIQDHTSRLRKDFGPKSSSQSLLHEHPNLRSSR